MGVLLEKGQCSTQQAIILLKCHQLKYSTSMALRLVTLATHALPSPLIRTVGCISVCADGSALVAGVNTPAGAVCGRCGDSSQPHGAILPSSQAVGNLQVLFEGSPPYIARCGALYTATASHGPAGPGSRLCWGPQHMSSFTTSSTNAAGSSSSSSYAAARRLLRLRALRTAGLKPGLRGSRLLSPRASQEAQQAVGLTEQAPGPRPSRGGPVPRDEYVEQVQSWEDTTPERPSLLQPSVPLAPGPDSRSPLSWAQDVMGSSNREASGKKKKAKSSSRQELPRTLESDFYDAGAAAAARQQGGAAWGTGAEEWGVERLTQEPQHKRRGAGSQAWGGQQQERLPQSLQQHTRRGEERDVGEEGYHQTGWHPSGSASQPHGRQQQQRARALVAAGPEDIWTPPPAPPAKAARPPPKSDGVPRQNRPDTKSNNKGREQHGAPAQRAEQRIGWIRSSVSSHNAPDDQLAALLQAATQRHGSLPPTEAGALLDKVSFIMRGARRQAQASSQQQQQQQPPSPPQESRPRVSDSDKASALATQILDLAAPVLLSDSGELRHTIPTHFMTSALQLCALLQHNPQDALMEALLEPLVAQGGGRLLDAREGVWPILLEGLCSTVPSIPCLPLHPDVRQSAGRTRAWLRHEMGGGGDQEELGPALMSAVSDSGTPAAAQAQVAAGEPGSPVAASPSVRGSSERLLQLTEKLIATIAAHVQLNADAFSAHNALPRLLVGLAKLEYPDRGVYERGAASLAQRQGDISDVALAHIAIAARTLAKTSVRVDPLLDLLADLVDKRPGALLPQTLGDLMYSFTYTGHPAAQRVVHRVSERLVKEVPSLAPGVVGACTTSLAFSSLDPSHPVYKAVTATVLQRPQEFAADRTAAARLLMGLARAQVPEAGQVAAAVCSEMSRLPTATGTTADDQGATPQAVATQAPDVVQAEAQQQLQQQAADSHDSSGDGSGSTLTPGPGAPAGAVEEGSTPSPSPSQELVSAQLQAASSLARVVKGAALAGHVDPALTHQVLTRARVAAPHMSLPMLVHNAFDMALIMAVLEQQAQQAAGGLQPTEPAQPRATAGAAASQLVDHEAHVMLARECEEMLLNLAARALLARQEVQGGRGEPGTSSTAAAAAADTPSAGPVTGGADHLVIYLGGCQRLLELLGQGGRLPAGVKAPHPSHAAAAGSANSPAQVVSVLDSLLHPLAPLASTSTSEPSPSPSSSSSSSSSSPVQHPVSPSDAAGAQLVAAAVATALGSDLAASPASIATTTGLGDLCVVAHVGGQQVALMIKAECAGTASTSAPVPPGLLSKTVGGRALQQFVLSKGGYRVVQVAAADVQEALTAAQRGEQGPLVDMLKQLLHQQ